MKLKIAARRNWKDRFYIKFKASKRAMIIVNKLLFDFDRDFILEEEVCARPLDNYDDWKDDMINFGMDNTKVEIDLLCGDKYIHMFVHKCPNYELVNKILDRYAEWVSSKYKEEDFVGKAKKKSKIKKIKRRK